MMSPPAESLSELVIHAFHEICLCSHDPLLEPRGWWNAGALSLSVEVAYSRLRKVRVGFAVDEDPVLGRRVEAVTSM